MERCVKRKRIEYMPVQQGPYFQKDEIEGDLGHSSDFESGLVEKRAKLDQRLKATFESIFDKYGRDFAGIGDEIDIATGEIVVNNGHVLRMQDEKDDGEANYWRLNEDKLEDEYLKSPYLSMRDNDASCDEDFPGQETKQISNLQGADSGYDQDEDDLILRGFVQASRFLKLSNEETPAQANVLPEESSWNHAKSTSLCHTPVSQNNAFAARPEYDSYSRFVERFPVSTVQEEDDIEPAWRVPKFPQSEKDFNLDSTRNSKSTEIKSLYMDYPRFAEPAESLWAPVKLTRRLRLERDSTNISNSKIKENGKIKVVRKTWNYVSGARRNSMFSMQNSKTRVSNHDESVLSRKSKSFYQEKTELYVPEEAKPKNDKYSFGPKKDHRSLKSSQDTDNSQVRKKNHLTSIKTYRASRSDSSYNGITRTPRIDTTQIEQNCLQQPSQAQNNHESTLESTNLAQLQEIRNSLDLELKANVLIADNHIDLGEKYSMSESHKDKSLYRISRNAYSEKNLLSSNELNQKIGQSFNLRSSSQPCTDQKPLKDKGISDHEVSANHCATSKDADFESNINSALQSQTTEDQDSSRSSEFRNDKLTFSSLPVQPGNLCKDKETYSMERKLANEIRPVNSIPNTASLSEITINASPIKVKSDFRPEYSSEKVSLSAHSSNISPASAQKKVDHLDLFCESNTGRKVLHKSDSGSNQSNSRESVSVSKISSSFSHSFCSLSPPTNLLEGNSKSFSPHNKSSWSANSTNETKIPVGEGLRHSDLKVSETKISTLKSNSNSHVAASEQAPQTPLKETKVCLLKPVVYLRAIESSSHFNNTQSRNLSSKNLELMPLLTNTKKESSLSEITIPSAPQPCFKENTNPIPSKKLKFRNSNGENIALSTPATYQRPSQSSQGSLSSKISDRSLTKSTGRKLFKNLMISSPKSEEIDELSLDQPERGFISVFGKCIKNKGVVKFHKSTSAVVNKNVRNVSKSENVEEDEDELSSEYILKNLFDNL